MTDQASKRIYLDHHATTPVDPRVRDSMWPYFSELFGNPSSSQHAFGQEAALAVDQARSELAELIRAEPGDIVFTSGATESDNLAVRGLARASVERGRHIVTTAIEHSALLEPCRTLEREGFEVTRVAVAESGVVDTDDVVAALRPDTVLVSVMAANNEIGTLQPVAAIGQACRERGIAFHSDAAQALGRVPVSVDDWGVDLMSLSAHKMYGPKGVGALYLRKGRRPRLRLQPQMEGGGQEKALRSGTLNVPGIVGLGAAARIAAEALTSGEPERLRRLRDRLLQGLRHRIPDVIVNGDLERRLPGNLHVSIPRTEAQTLILSLRGTVALSSGAACSEAGGQGSHVLRAIGLPDERVYSALRIGLGRYNTDADVDAAVDALVEAVQQMRARSSQAVT